MNILVNALPELLGSLASSGFVALSAWTIKRLRSSRRTETPNE